MQTGQPIQVALALFVTLGILYVVPDRLMVLALFLVCWWLIFSPLTIGEMVMFVFASAFFLVQNYVTLKEGLFEFRFKDILLMPWYEPVLWGFYFLALKRFIAVTPQDRVTINLQSVAAVVVTSLMFSLFSHDSRLLFMATCGSTALLFAMFHTRADIRYALAALGLGLIVELFGVTAGFWWYPAPDFLGIPYWFATMWMSVGLLGRRFVIPVSEWLSARLAPQGA